MISEPSSSCKLLFNGQVLERLSFDEQDLLISHGDSCFLVTGFRTFTVSESSFSICHSIGEGLWLLSTHICKVKRKAHSEEFGKLATNPVTVSVIRRSRL